MLPREQYLVRSYLGVLICLVAALYMWVRAQPYEPRFSEEKIMGGWHPTAQDMAVQRRLDSQRLLGFEVAEEDQALLKGMREFHRVETALADGGESDLYADSVYKLRMQVEEFVRNYGMPRYLQLGLFVRAQFMETLEIFLAGRQLPRGREASERLVDLAGDFIQWSQRAGLIRDGNAPSKSELFLVEILFKFRWLRWGQKVEGMEGYITRFEKSVLLTFQLNRYPGVDLDRRLEMVEELAHLVPGYPTAERRVEVLVRAGELQRARDSLQKALLANPKSVTLREMKRQLWRDTSD